MTQQKITGEVAGRHVRRFLLGHVYVYATFASPESCADLVFTAVKNRYTVLKLKENSVFSAAALREKAVGTSPLHCMKSLERTAKFLNICQYSLHTSSPDLFVAKLLQEAIHRAYLQKWYPSLAVSLKRVGDVEKIDNFKVIFETEISPEDRQRLRNLIQKSAQLLRAADLECLIYGTINIVKELPGKRVADYLVSEDMVRIATEERQATTELIDIVHELLHRYYKKFPLDKKLIRMLHAQVQQDILRDMPSPGDIFLNKDGGQLVVKQCTKQFCIFMKDNKRWKCPIWYLLCLQKIKGKQLSKYPNIWVPSLRSMKDAEEWFCEVVARGVIQDIPEIKSFLHYVEEH